MYATNRQLISRVTKSGGLVKNELELYDLEDPINKKFLQAFYVKYKNKIDAAGGLPKLEGDAMAENNGDPGSNYDFLPDDFDINDYPVTKLIKKFGAPLAKQIIDLEKNRAEAVKKTQEFQLKAGELIERETVAVQLFHYLEVLNKNLMMHPERTAERLLALMQTKKKDKKKKIIELVTSYITKSIKDTKKELKKRLEKIRKEQILKNMTDEEKQNEKSKN